MNKATNYVASFGFNRLVYFEKTFWFWFLICLNILRKYYLDILLRHFDKDSHPPYPSSLQMRHFDLYGKFKQSKQRRLKRSHIGSWKRQREAKMGHIKMPRLETKEILLERILLKRNLLEKQIRKDKIGWLRCIDCEWYIRFCKDANFIGFRLSASVGVRRSTDRRGKVFLGFATIAQTLTHSLSHNDTTSCN